jgi:hypothetical protein
MRIEIEHPIPTILNNVPGVNRLIVMDFFINASEQIAAEVRRRRDPFARRASCLVASYPTFLFCLTDEPPKILKRQEGRVLAPNPSASHSGFLANDIVTQTDLHAPILIKLNALQAENLFWRARLGGADLVRDGVIKNSAPGWHYELTSAPNLGLKNWQRFHRVRQSLEWWPLRAGRTVCRPADETPTHPPEAPTA